MHWTYEDPPDQTQLCQGDLLRRSPALEGLLNEFHPFYQRKDDNRFFLVLTQGCDLVLRNGGKCTTPYVTIAAVRPMRLAIDREVQALQRDEIERTLRFGDKSRKAKLDQFIERLLNNNEPSYFYLRREPSCDLAEDHCAFLKLSIPLKAEHYGALVEAKVLQLTEPFQHKLGYLVGNLYSRVGTKDWTDHGTPEEYERVMAEPLQGDMSAFVWLDKPTHDHVLRNLRKAPAEERTIEKLEALVKEAGKAREARRVQVLDAVDQVLKELDIGENLVRKARQRLQNDPRFAAGIR